jgi:hypothetical protein
MLQNGNPTQPRKAIAYIRVSSQRQVDEGVSIQAQKRRILECVRASASEHVAGKAFRMNAYQHGVRAGHASQSQCHVVQPGFLFVVDLNSKISVFGWCGWVTGSVRSAYDGERGRSRSVVRHGAGELRRERLEGSGVGEERLVLGQRVVRSGHGLLVLVGRESDRDSLDAAHALHCTQLKIRTDAFVREESVEEPGLGCCERLLGVGRRAPNGDVEDVAGALGERVEIKLGAVGLLGEAVRLELHRHKERKELQHHERVPLDPLHGGERVVGGHPDEDRLLVGCGQRGE